MITRKIPDSSVPKSLLAYRPHVRFSRFQSGVGTFEAEMR